MHLSTWKNQGLRLSQDAPFTWSLLLPECWLCSPFFRLVFSAFLSSILLHLLIHSIVVAFQPDCMAGTALGTKEIVVTRKMSALRELVFSWSGESHRTNECTNNI